MDVASSSSSNTQTAPWSASASPSNWEHDVFLSFRGEDTRNNFTDHLYYAMNQRGIDAFRDTEKLLRGKSISPELLKAIEESKFAVTVLSTNYATSTWCLDELAHILECQKMGGLEVLPVFYHVDPSEIRKQTGNYGKAFAKHETDFKDNMRKVENWRNSLKDIASLAGWHVTEHSSEAEVVEAIVCQIRDTLNDVLSVPERELVGMDARIRKIESRLDLGSNDVLTIGIWGMGGIGKSTLAKEVFKKFRNKFHPSGFVSQVGLKSELELLQSLCESFLGDGKSNINTVEKGIRLLKKALFKKKVLIILDDFDDFKQIECLAPGGPLGVDYWGGGSRLIITSRDKSSWSNFNVQEDKIYEVEILRDDEAFRLLCQKAFKKDNPPEEFETLSKSFLQYAGGLPLAHEVLGSYLSRRKIEEWSEILHRLDDDRDKDIFSVLQISFDGLQPTDKKIFLDIACFFHGEGHVRVKNILKGCGFSSEIGISNLIDKSLIKIERNKLWMHDLLRCLGWHIVHEESSVPGKRSRLWLDDSAHKYEGRSSWRFEDARKVLMDNTGTADVQGLFFSLHEKEEMALENDPFLTMCNLRLLKIYNVNFLDMHFTHFSKDLRLLEWHGCPLQSLPSNFKSEKLVEIKMPNSRIEQLWNEKLSLKWLLLMDLSHCQSLSTTPDFSKVPNLERLILEGCTELTVVHPSIGDLQKLVLLNLKGCASLESLSDSISLSSLQILILSGCSKVKEFPEIVGNMSTLSELHLDGTAITELHVSIQHLKGLVLLNLSGCRSLVSIPSIICKKLTSLKFLRLSLCSSLDSLPDNIGCVVHLEELDACNTAIRTLTESTLLLEKLKLLCIRGCGGITSLELPNKFSGLTSLTTLNLGGCNLSEGAIPDDFGALISLESLDLSENKFFTIPESISQLSKLTEISLFKCTNLRSLPKDVPPSLRNVDIRGCPMLTNSSSSWKRCTPQKGLSIINCRRTEEYEIFSELYKFPKRNLEELDLSYCQHLEKVPDMNGVPNLKKLNLEGCEKLSEVHQTVGRLQHLIFLSLKGCVDLESLPRFISLKSLQIFVLSGCSKLKEFPDIIGNMDHLSELHLDGTALKHLAVPGINLKCPISINLSGCWQLRTIPLPSNLKSLNLSGCTRISRLPSEGMVHLEELDVSETSIKQVHQSYFFLTKVQVLSFSGCKGLQLPKWFSDLNSLTSLNLRRCGLAEDVLDILCGLSSLKNLDLGENSFVTLPNSIGRLSLLHRLDLSGNSIESIPHAIGHLSSLQVLDLTRNNFVSMPHEIGHLSSLEVLRLSENKFASLPESISRLSRLTELRLFKCSNLQSLPNDLPLSLKHVYVQQCPLLKYNADTLTIRASGEGFCFMHCKKSEQDDDQPSHVPIPVPKDCIELLFPIYIANRVYAKKPFEIRFPHSARIPNLWSHWRSGSSVTIPLSDGNSSCMGFSLFVVFEILEKGEVNKIWELEETICEFQTDIGRENSLVFQNFIAFKAGSYALCCYEPRGGKCGGIFDKLSTQLQATVSTKRPYLKVKGCGIRLISEEDTAEFVTSLAIQTAIQHLDTNFDQHCKNILEDETKTGDLMELGSTSTFNEDSSSRLDLNIQAREELLLHYEGRHAREKSFYLAFPAPIISFPPWFSNHHAGDVTICQLTGNLLDKTWVGLELYVDFTRRASTSSAVAESFSFYVDFCGHDRATIISNGSLKIDSFLGASDQLVILHLPRVCFQQRLDECRGISALFRPIDQEMQVQVCGSRFLFERDLIYSLEAAAGTSWGKHVVAGDPIFEAQVVDGHRNTITTDKKKENDETVDQGSKLDGAMPVSNSWFERLKLLNLSELNIPSSVQVLPEQAPTSSIMRLQKYSCYFQQNQGSVEFNIALHSRGCLLGNKDSNQEYVAEEDTTSLLNRHHLCVMVETLVYGTYSSPKWKRWLELLLLYSKSATISNNGHGLPAYKHFNPSSTYNICLSQDGLPLWFPYSSGSRVGMRLPPKLCDYDNWRGVVICAAFKVDDQHPLSPEVKLMCHLRSKDYCLNPIPMCSMTKVKLSEPLYRGGFIWVTYIPRVFLTEFNVIRDVEARIYCNCPILKATKCGIRLLHRHEEEEFENVLTGCCTSFFDDSYFFRKLVQAARVDEHFEEVDVKEFDRDFIYDATPSTWLTGHFQSEYSPPENLPDASSSRPLSSWNYDVFLSFRVEDTRNLTDHLYSALCEKGIETFRDTAGLRRGNSIAPELRKVIEESKFAVIILSRNYADSKWCLDELAYILECKKETGLQVFPVFYDVNPSEVRQQTGYFGDAFTTHEQDFMDNTGKVENWRQALKEIASVSGWDVEGRSESEVIREITIWISNRLNQRTSSRDRNLIEMDARIEAVVSHLDLASENVLTVGIWGMGGIGKTTIAKEVYKEIHNQFHTSGVVCNVRLQSQVELQKLVCESFFGDCYVDTVKKDSKWTRLSKKKVLLVLDDVDELNQIQGLVPGGLSGEENFWGPGSRLIITTRDRRTLTELGVLEHKIYEVKKLNDEEASQLLCQKAFKKVNPPTEFVELSKSFLKYACGLPLALEVLGSHLSGRNADEWSEVLDRLDEDLDKDIFSVLQISFDGLHTIDKKIFLDIACFFNGEDAARVRKILKGCGFSSRIGIINLVDKSLVKIERGKLWMHDLLRCLGWHIVRKESPLLPGNRSRLWLDDNAHKYETRRSWLVEDARDVLTENTGTRLVEGLFLSLPEKEEIRLNSDPFELMSKLRLLKICNVNFLDVRFSYPCRNLRLLEWHECPLESLSSWCTSGQLVELRIPNSRTERLWDGSIKMNTLVHMDLSNCRYLTMAPDLSVAPNIETLILEDCTELSEVHHSIMELQHLVLLNLKGCVGLMELPDGINLRSLQTFTLSGCTNLSKFPRFVDIMWNLAELHLDGTAIHDLDPSFKFLRGLVLLNLSRCKNLRTLPTSVCRISSLKFLYLSSCSSLETLPGELCLLGQLEELDMCQTAIKEVPGVISWGLGNLKLLCFHGCSGLRVRNLLLRGFRSLTTLNLGRCNLEEGDIPDGIGELHSLQSLDLSENYFFSIPESICQLPELKEISVRDCAYLKWLPSIDPPSIKYVDIRGCTMLLGNLSDGWMILPDGLRIRSCRRLDHQRPPSGVSV